MKKLVTLSLFVFWSSVAAVLAAGLVFYQDNKISAPSSQSPDNNLTSSITSNLAAGTVLDMAQISKHNSATDCWLLINNKVYNVTSYLSLHPGGAGTIIPHCGQEATQAFATKDIGRPHSSSAVSLLTNYFIGNFGATVNQSNPLSIASQTSPLAANNSSQTPPQTQPAASPTQSPPPSAPAGVALTLTELAKHNKTSDCWLLINNKIYNVTSYISAHPGGASAIISYCGQDATTAFATKGGNTPHSSNAVALLANYYIGDLNQTTTQQQIDQNVQNTNSTPPPTGGDDKEDND